MGVPPAEDMGINPLTLPMGGKQMADNEQELLREIADILGRNSGDSWEVHNKVAKEVVAKLKAMGYEQVWTKCSNPDCRDGKEQVPYGYRFDEWHWIDCKICKGTGRITNYKSPEEVKELILDEHEQHQDDVKWDSKKVAEHLYSDNEPTLIYDGVTFNKCREIYPEKVESYLEEADQLKEILTGEANQ